MNKIIDGNFEDKYHAKNPLSKILMNGFLTNFKSLLNAVDSVERVAEFGAGEGYLTEIIVEKFPNAQVWASDISQNIVDQAAQRIKSSNVKLNVEDVESLSYPDNFFDLIICCEVLEHVTNPSKALAEIRRTAKDKVLVSVPQEPVWRVLNMMRFKYLNSLGNTPGHVNHWSKSSFEGLLVNSGFTVLKRMHPFPWQMYLLEK